MSSSPASCSQATVLLMLVDLEVRLGHACGLPGRGAVSRQLERVMILDSDVHHGNRTNQIFRASKQVLFVSIHQSPLFPGTGPADDVGGRQWASASR